MYWKWKNIYSFSLSHSPVPNVLLTIWSFYVVCTCLDWDLDHTAQSIFNMTDHKMIHYTPLSTFQGYISQYHTQYIIGYNLMQSCFYIWIWNMAIHLLLDELALAYATALVDLEWGLHTFTDTAVTYCCCHLWKLQLGVALWFQEATQRAMF